MIDNAKKTWEQLFSEAEKEAAGSPCGIYAAFTDEVLLEKWNDTLIQKIVDREKYLLELRVFSQRAEYKAFRGDIGRDLRFRVRIDEETEKQDYFDEVQYLEHKAGWLVVRNYVSYYEESGQAYVSDWRILERREGEQHGRI